MASAAVNRFASWETPELESNGEDLVRGQIRALASVAAMHPEAILEMDEGSLRKALESTERNLRIITEDLGCPMLRHVQDTAPALAAEYERARIAADRKLRLGRAIVGHLLCDEEVLTSLRSEREIREQAEAVLGTRFAFCSYVLRMSAEEQASLQSLVEHPVQLPQDTSTVR